MAAPAAVEEGRLEDDIGAVAPSRRALRPPRPGVAAGVRVKPSCSIVDDGLPDARSRSRYARFVLRTPRLHELDLQVLARSGAPRGLPRDRAPAGEVVTGEEADEVRRAEDGVPSKRSARPTVAADRVSLPVAVALACGHESAATGCRGPAAVGQDVGEPRRAPDPGGDGRRRLRRPAVPGRTPADRGRLGGRRVGDGLPDAAQRRRGAALDRIRQGGAQAARGARGADRTRAADLAALASARAGGPAHHRRGGQPRHRTGQRRGADRPPAPTPARPRRRGGAPGASARPADPSDVATDRRAAASRRPGRGSRRPGTGSRGPTPSRRKPAFSSDRCSAMFSTSVWASIRFIGVSAKRNDASCAWASAP